MKKALSLILSATLLFACVSCYPVNGGLNDKESESEPKSTFAPLESETSSPPQEEALPSVLFSTYDDILNTVSSIAKTGGKEAFEASMPQLDTREQTIYQTLCNLTSQMLDKPTKQEMLSHFLDIDGDGNEELVVFIWEVNNLLKETQTVFTLHGGVPMQDDGTLLERYRQEELYYNSKKKSKTARDPSPLQNYGGRFSGRKNRKHRV